MCKIYHLAHRVYEEYYSTVQPLGIDERETSALVRSLRKPLPVTFRVNGCHHAAPRVAACFDELASTLHK